MTETKNGHSTQWHIVILIFLVSIASWGLALKYRGASDFSDTVNYMASGKSLAADHTFMPHKVQWDEFVAGKGNLNDPLSYPGQLFSLGIGWFSKLIGEPIQFWHILVLNFIFYCVGCWFCLLFLARYLKGFELLVIGFLTTTSYYVFSATVSTLSDGIAWTIFVIALWLSTHEKKHVILCGLLFGISFFIRVHMAIFALFFPLLLCDKFDKKMMMRTLVFYLTVLVSYAGVNGFLHYYTTESPAISVSEFAQSKGIDADFPTVDEAEDHVTTTSGLATFGWYHGHLKKLDTLKHYGIGWFTKGIFLTVGPVSYFFGPLFFIVLLSLLLSWNDAYLYRCAVFLVCTFFVFYASAYILLAPGSPEQMIGELTTLGRYFCYFITLLLPIFWVVARERLSVPDWKWGCAIATIVRRIPLLNKLENPRMVMVALFLFAIFPASLSYWGYGAALLTGANVRSGIVRYQSDNELTEHLADLTSDSLVLCARSTPIQVFTPVRFCVAMPRTPQEFFDNTNNHLFDAIVVYPNSFSLHVPGITEDEIQAWKTELEKDVLTDCQGNRFVKVHTCDGEGMSDSTREMRAFTVFRREGQVDSAPERRSW